MSNSTYDDPGDVQDSRPQTSTSAINQPRNTSVECEISRATNSKCEFGLASSKDGLGAFDDIVLKINKDSKCNNYFFQLKNKERAKVTPGSLLSLKHDFSLFKLHQSYLEVQSYFESNPSDPLFNGKLSNCYYILYTNAQLDSHIKPHNGDIDLKDLDTHINPHIGETNLTDDNMTVKSVLQFNEVRHKDIIDGISHLTKSKEFFNQFIIMYNQANNDTLDTLIQAELTKSVYLQKYDIRLAYSIFRDFIQDWWQKSNIILKESWDSFNPLRKTKERIRLIELNEIFENRKNELKKLNLTFNSQSLSEIKNKIEMSNSTLIFAPGRSTTITAAKLHQSLGDLSPHRFINLLNLDTYIQEIKATWPSEYSRLIVEIPNTDTEYVNLYSEIREILKEEMKVVFIIQNTGNLKQLNSLETEWKSILKKVHDCTIISDFETLTQESFLQKRIMFQGHEISLSELINIDDVHILKGLDIDSLSLLLANEKPTIGSELPNSPDFYIDRTLQSNLFVSTEIFNEKGIVFALFGTTFSELSYIVPTGEKLYDFNEWKDDLDYRFLYVDNFDNFNRLCMSESRPTLWLRKERDGLLLKQSNADRKLIKRYLEESYVTESMPNDIMEDEDRVLLITAEPGMGKSTLLTHLTKQTQIRHPNIWVVRIDINYHSKLLHRIKLDGFTDNDAIELLSSAAGINGSHCIGLASNLFRHCCFSTGNMAVLVDGIDEVSPSYFNEVIKILIVLSKTKISKIWLTSRPFLKSELEYALGITSYVLKPFNKEDQIKFLVKFWKNRFFSIDTSLLSRIATHSLEQLSKHLNGNEIDFLGIPLQSLLLAEIIEKRLQADGFNVVIDSRSLNLLILYDLYVDKKWQIYLQEKKNSDITNVNVILDEKDLYDIYIRNHEVAAMVSIFENEELKELQSSIVDSQWITFLKKIERGEEKTGMILRSHMGRPIFVHRTFAEYFAAKWFYNNFHSCKAFLRQRIFEPRFQVIKSIFDRLLAKDSPLHLAVLNNDLVGVRKILANDKNTTRQDKGGRTALHLAVTYSRINIIKLLLNHCVDFSICDSILEMSILQYGLNSKNFLALSLVMENKHETIYFIKNLIDIKALKHILIICSQNGYLKVLHYIFEIKKDLLTEDFRNELMVEAIRHGQIAFISRLIKIGTRTNIINAQGKTLLHISSESGQLQVIKFLLEYRKSGLLGYEGTDDICRHCQNPKWLNVQEWEVFQRSTAKMEYLELPDTEGNTILHLAAKVGHIHILRYLVVELGCNVKSLNNCNQTLLKATRTGNILGVKCLLNKLADVNIMDNNNSTALDIAIKNGDLELIKYLHERGALWRKEIFFSAIKNGYTDVIHYFLKNEGELQQRNERNQTMLHIACQLVRCQSVVYLIFNGIHMDIQDQSGRTALHYAVESGNLFNVSCLIQHGASVFIEDFTGSIPLHTAAGRGIYNVSKYLIKHHSPIDAHNMLMQTPLFIAAINGHEKICRALIQAGAGIFVKDANGVFLWDLLQTKGQDNVIRIFQERAIGLLSVTSTEPTALHRAAERGDIRCVKRLLGEGVPIDCGDHLGRTALWRASFNGHSSIVELLCEEGSGSTIPDLMGIKPIHAASSQKYYNIVETLLKNYIHLSDNVLVQMHTDEIQVATLLLDSGSCIACKDTIRWTPLQIAADCGYAGIVKILIRSQCYLDLKNNEGKTALHLAAYKCHTDCVNHLLENGASLNLQDNRGRTPLHAAVFGGKLEVIELLLHCGAKADIADDEQMLPLTTAVSNGRIDMVELLLKCDANNSSISMLFLTAIRSRDIQMVQFLQNIEPAVIESQMQGTTPLIIAAYNGDFEIVQILLQSGADINVQSNDGWTPLHVSVYRNHINVAKLLILEGGNINVPSKNGTTALHISVINENIELTKFLLEKNAEVNVVDENGCSALHLAAETGNEEIVNLMLKCDADVNLLNKDNWTAFHVASRYGRKEVAEILMKNGFAPGKSRVKPLYLSVSSGHIEFTNMLLNNGFDVNEDLGSGITALYLSFAFNFYELSELLLEKGAIVELVQILVQNYALISATQKDGNSALGKELVRKYIRIIQCSLNIEETFENERLAKKINYFASKLSLLSGVIIDVQTVAKNYKEEKKEMEKEKASLIVSRNGNNNHQIAQDDQNDEIVIQNNEKITDDEITGDEITDDNSNDKREISSHDDAESIEKEISVNSYRDCNIM
ncbi:hypothetical protein C0J52_09025 [Blattella germanica]|nr:hypothetical protein C0J52_09025 [Blattella germanica]